MLRVELSHTDIWSHDMARSHPFTSRVKSNGHAICVQSVVVRTYAADFSQLTSARLRHRVCEWKIVRLARVPTKGRVTVANIALPRAYRSVLRLYRRVFFIFSCSGESVMAYLATRFPYAIFSRGAGT
jgi:hypothetical protein